MVSTITALCGPAFEFSPRLHAYLIFFLGTFF
jgi:hypothetical protein